MYLCMYACMSVRFARDLSSPGPSFAASATISTVGLQLSLPIFAHVVAQKHNSPSFKDYLLGEVETLEYCG
jgi:hypothetical protein